MASGKRLARAFGAMPANMPAPARMEDLLGAVGWNPTDGRGQRFLAAAEADPQLAARMAEIMDIADPIEQGRQMRQFSAQNISRTDPAPAGAPPATPRLEPPGKPSVEAQRQRVEAEQAALETYQMDLQPSRAGDGPVEFTPDPARRELSASDDISPDTTASDPPASWADDPDAPGYVAPQTADPAFDDFINRLGDQARPRQPTLAENARQAGGQMWDRAMRAGRGGMDNARARINAMPPGLLPATGLGIAGLGAGIYMANQAGPPQGSAAAPVAPPVPNIIRPPQPMSTADLAAQASPPPSVQTTTSPRDQAMQMIDDLNARRRAAGGEVPDAPQTMQKVNRLLAMSNEQSAAASRGDIPVQGNGPREQAQRILAQLNAMRQQAGGEVPQAGQMMAEVRRLQAMSDQQANARRAG